MTDLYVSAMVRMRETELRRTDERARWERGWPPRDGRQPVSRTRIVLARWLMAAAERLWPQAGREAMGATR